MTLMTGIATSQKILLNEHLDVQLFYQSPDHNSRNRSFGIEKIDNSEEVIVGLVYHLKLFYRLKILNLSHACLSLRAL